MTNASLAQVGEMIQSSDRAVLLRCLDFAYRCHERESNRGRTAETRATATLAILGVVVGLVVPQAANLPQMCTQSFWFLATTYVVPLLYLLTGIVHAFCVLSATQRLRVEVDTVFELQDKTELEALRVEITAVVWECKNAVQPNTAKLWHLERCQRKGLLALFALVVFGVALLLSNQLLIDIPSLAAVIYVTVAVLAAVLESKIFRGVNWS